MTVTATAPSDSPPRAGWDALTAELDAWAAGGRTATLWWRDDDAVEPTPGPGRMGALSRGANAPPAPWGLPGGRPRGPPPPVGPG
ncbi:hypothetical protein GAY28_35010, partial [Azospirillum brasilense]|nr:hypothetical protein [Azospirillum brasilense]